MSTPDLKVFTSVIKRILRRLLVDLRGLGGSLKYLLPLAEK